MFMDSEHIQNLPVDQKSPLPSESLSVLGQFIIPYMGTY